MAISLHSFENMLLKVVCNHLRLGLFNSHEYNGCLIK